MEKTLPKVGEQLYLRQFTGRAYVDFVKRPYTVIKVENNKVTIQSAKLIFPLFKYNPATMSEYYKQFDNTRPQFFNTVAESIEPDEFGRIEELTWHSKRGMWGTKGADTDYPEYAIFGKYEHQPYLD